MAARYMNKPAAIMTAAVAAALLLVGCGDKEQEGAAAQQQAGQERPAPVVGVVTVKPETVTLNTDLPGRLEAFRTAEVRAQVGGIIKKRLFQEGSYVKAGQALYQLDDATYAANLQSARASLAAAEAALAKARADLARYRPLVAEKAISEQEYDAAVAAKRAAEAQVQSSQAAIRSAKINVNYSRVTAPISGFIGQSNVSEGTLVSANDPTVLTTIRQTNPLYVNLTQSATSVMQLRQKMASGAVQSTGGAVEVSVLLEDGSEYPLKGRLLFVDPTVDQSTGQVTLRAEIPNPDGVLLPGLYVRVRLPQGRIDNAFLVPQQAVTRGKQNTVMVVNADGSMAPKVVQIADQQGSNLVITGGLAEGDKVIVDGMAIAGMSGAQKVTPKEWQNPANAQPNAANTPSETEQKDESATEQNDVQTASQPQAASAE